MTIICSNHYQRFGDWHQAKEYYSTIVDWRLGFNIGFYFYFAFMQATLATHEQKRGIRIGLGIGIVFLFAEVHMIKAVEFAGLKG